MFAFLDGWDWTVWFMMLTAFFLALEVSKHVK